jgi:hypothetical protein
MNDLWLVEMNLSTLFANTSVHHAGRILSADDVKIIDVKYDILPPNSLVIRGTIGGITDVYKTVIKFPEVSVKGKTPVQTITGIKKITKINPRTSDAEVFCTCTFFYWAFNTQNHKASALFDPTSNLRTEEPIGSPRGRSPNPSGVPGLCKHLVALTNYLKDEKIITRI